MKQQVEETDAITGISIWREYTSEELKLRQQIDETIKAQNDANAILDAEKEAKKIIILDKLGITADEAKLLLS